MRLVMRYENDRRNGLCYVQIIESVYDDCDELDEENFIFDDDGAYRYPRFDSTTPYRYDSD